METVFTEVAVQHALSQAIDSMGGSTFWQSHVSLLKCMTRLDNSLVAHIEAGKPPEILHAYSSKGDLVAPAMTLYLDGLYLLDPFYQACSAGLESGLFTLEGIAPDRFLQSEYFSSYFNETVGKDEAQLILKTGPSSYLSVSIGLQSKIETKQLGLLHFHAPTLLSLMRAHWRIADRKPSALPPTEEAASKELQVEKALDQFGSGVLSTRELEIARLILRGNSSKAISSKLNISADTVKAHRRHLYSKLGINSQSELFSIFLKALE